MYQKVWFAVYSCRRDGEIYRLHWYDLNYDNRTCLLRDLKHPTKSWLTKLFKVPSSALKIIEQQKKESEFIFPYNSQTISKSFANACKMCGIDDLRFQDLRHEGVSRLFEAGLSIQQVQLISLHSNWETLKRYTNLNPGDVDI